MDDSAFQAIKGKLDTELDKLDPGSPIGINMGWGLYVAFRDRGLLKPKEVDGLLWKWTQPSYRDRFVVDGLNHIQDDQFQIGKPDA